MESRVASRVDCQLTVAILSMLRSFLVSTRSSFLRTAHPVSTRPLSSHRPSPASHRSTMADPARLKQPVSQHTWQLPLRRSGTEEPTLKVYNSLTRTKVSRATRQGGTRAQVVFVFPRSSS